MTVAGKWRFYTGGAGVVAPTLFTPFFSFQKGGDPLFSFGSGQKDPYNGPFCVLHIRKILEKVLIFFQNISKY